MFASMIGDCITYCQLAFERQERTTRVLAAGLLILAVLGLLVPISQRFFWPWGRPRMLRNVYIAGLDDGKRSLRQAQEHFMYNCGEMLLEGHEKAHYSLRESHSLFSFPDRLADSIGGRYI